MGTGPQSPPTNQRDELQPKEGITPIAAMAEERPFGSLVW